MDKLITIRLIKPHKLALSRGAPSWSNYTAFNAPFVFQISSLPLQPSTTTTRSGMPSQSQSPGCGLTPCLLLFLVRGTIVLVQLDLQPALPPAAPNSRWSHDLALFRLRARALKVGRLTQVDKKQSGVLRLRLHQFPPILGPVFPLLAISYRARCAVCGRKHPL